MWELEYTREANNYALDSGCPLGPYNEDVLIAIEMLAQTPDGLPVGDVTEWPPGHFTWKVAGHRVFLQRILVPRPKLRIIAIQPQP